MTMIHAVRRRSLGPALALGATMLAAVAFAAPATTGAVSVGDWSRQIWSSAQSGDETRVDDLLGRLPEQSDVDDIRSLRASVDRLRMHAAARESHRAERRQEVETELTENLTEGKLPEALVSAVELHELSDDKAAVLTDPRITALVDRAETEARDAELAGDWLDAHGLFFRLALLFDEDKRYEEDVIRMSKRLALLRKYAPERLHFLRNEQRIAEGEDELPPFNPLGEDWRERVAGVDEFMIRKSLNWADARHVERIPMARLIEGGLESVRTLVTTTDLAETFTGLADARAREEMLHKLDELIAEFELRQEADNLTLGRVISSLMGVNNRSVNLPRAVVLRTFGEGAIDGLDEFSAVIWPDEMERFMRSTTGRFQGVGIQISLDESLNLEVVTPLEGTPAQRAGIRRGDLITKVDGESTLGISLIQAVDRITGDAGTPVTLTIERASEEKPFDVTLTRAEIPIYSVKGWVRNGPHEDDWDWFIDESNGVGYVRLTQFTESTTRDFDRAIREMQREGMRGLILDMRFNPGGLLSQAVSIANRFVDGGLIVSQHDGAGLRVDSQSARRGQATLADVPVVVLINDGSASASEIVAGALQDYAERGEIDAVIVGQRSFGKGSVQNIYDLGAAQALFKLTEHYYRLPNGRLIHRRDGDEDWGVEPDIEIRALPSELSDAIELRMEADILAIDEKGRVDPDAEAPPDPTRLLTDGLDPQLETALLLLQTRAVAAKAGDIAIAAGN